MMSSYSHIHLQKNLEHILAFLSCFQPRHWVDRSRDIWEEEVVEGRRLLKACQVSTWQDFYQKATRDDSHALDIGRLMEVL